MLSVLNDAANGKTLTRDEALLLSSVGDAEFYALLAAAAEVRDRAKGNCVSFSPKVFVPLTNLCRDFCGYCTFRKAPDEPGAKTLTLEEVLRVVRHGKLLGCTEVLFSLGDKPEAIYSEMRRFLAENGHRRTLDYLYEACETVLEETAMLPHSNAGLLGKRDLLRLKEVNASLGLMVENVSDRLMRPGGPHADAPDKKPSARLATIAEAGKLRIPFTSGILIGIGETWEERVDSLFALRDLNQRYGHLQEIIIQNFRAKPQIPMRHHPEPSYRDMLKTIAVARLIFGGDMNIQAPPNLTPENYQSYLDAGINDWGGVSPLTPDFINPEAPWPALSALREKSEKCGFVLKARLPIYPEFVARSDEFLPPAMISYVEQLCDSDGWVKDGGPLARL